MNKLLITYCILINASLLFGCGGPSKRKNEKSIPVSTLVLHQGNDRYIPVDTKASVISWKGSSMNGLNTQTGYVYLSKGELLLEEGRLTGGTIEVNMNSIEDKNHARDNKLVNHLKDPDFFEVEKFPFARILITKAALIDGENKKVTGNLTIKGITHPVTFPTLLEIKDGVVKANGRLVIDRTLWNVRYKSAKFYAGLANQTMSDSVEFHIQILAKKQR